MKQINFQSGLVLGVIISLVSFSCNPEKESPHQSSGTWDATEWSGFHEQAMEESLIPVRPGENDASPFWNGYAKRFIYVPSFDFEEIGGSVSYRYSVTSDVNCETYKFEADHPRALLSPVWKELPVGIVYVKVEGLDEEEQVCGLAGEKLFYKAAPFNGPYNPPARDYVSSVILNMESFLQQDHYRRWGEESTPSDDYRLYCYPSKIVGSIVQAMCMYSDLAEEESELAIRMAENAASYLLSISFPEGAVLEYFPPTYQERKLSTHVARRKKDQLMMFYPALVGDVYLDLYDATGKDKYLDASVRIAQTYAKTQLSSGSWPMMVWIESGEAVEENLCVPTDIINFLDRLDAEYGIAQFRENSKAAFHYIMENPMKTFHWEAQFEDMGYSKNYSNMERGKPLAFAVILLRHSDEEPAYVAMAEELIRFAEDQFIVWEQPLARELFREPWRPIPRRVSLTSKWFTPCALEQYGFYTPIDASSASAIFAYKKAYEVTGKELCLAKAVSLADNLTLAQELAGGIIPTYVMDLGGEKRFSDPSPGVKEKKVWTGWLNCATISSKALLELNEILEN